MAIIDRLLEYAPKARDPEGLKEALRATCQRFDISTLRRQRYFIAQASFETQGFTAWSENLNYSTPERLVAVWPSRFTMDVNNKTKAYAPDYAKNPEKLANLVYAGRVGNGDAASGDGWSFRGRGAFHLTFRNNYKDCSDYLYKDNRFVTNPDLVMASMDGLMSAGWFWNANGMNKLADADEFTKVTKIINGSDVTVPERLKVLNVLNRID